MTSTTRTVVAIAATAMVAALGGCMSDGAATTAQSHDDAWCNAHPKQCDNKDWCAKHPNECTSSGGN